MTTATPTVPPRPTRSSHAQAAETPSGGTGPALSKVPSIPPRPARRLERSTSPQRFARSPLNEAPIHFAQGGGGKSSLYSSESAANSEVELTRTTSNVDTLPSVGQEGHEYADMFQAEDPSSSPKEARVVGEDVKLHAPKPSVAASTAKQRVAGVTRTDSDQAAAYGIGKGDPSAKALKTKASFASQASNGGSDPVAASYDSDHGIPEIGQRVPMYPNAGDVQAPSPQPGSSPFTPGIGFHNDGSRTSLHGRKSSQVNFDIPADAYGKHGHGVMPHDRFERAYYEKHPELVKRELDQFHEKAEWAMSSDDLNDLVRGTASRSAGFGTNPEVGSIPSEQVGFKATEEYASRMASPMVKPTEPDDLPGVSQAKKAQFESALSRGLAAEKASQGKIGEQSVIHVDPGEEYRNKIYGGDIPPGSTNSLGVQQDIPEDPSQIREQFAYSAPILAEDEVAKTPVGSFMQPAVSPMPDHRFESGEGLFYGQKTGSTTSLPGSRPTSRPGSMQHNDRHGLVGTTHLDDLEEYEPLFPEDDKDGKNVKPMSIDDKRRDLKNKKFPSQDIWEDTPNSLQYTTIVSTPDLPAQKPVSELDYSKADGAAAIAFAKKQEHAAEVESTTPDSFLGPAKKAWRSDADLAHDGHSQHGRRFPSRDIWEDTPDSHRLETTVDTPQMEDRKFAGASSGTSPTDENPAQPQIPERPVRSKDPANRGLSTSPPPPVSKAKPLVPARPVRAKPQSKDSSDDVALTKTTSNTSTGAASAAASKPKPPIPSRPVGGKIAALQGGFMADLNKRLQLGPQAAMKAAEDESKDDEEGTKNAASEKVPLVDARKGRARGPQRRAPATSKSVEGSEASTERSASQKGRLGLGVISTVFEVDPAQGEGFVAVGGDGAGSSGAPTETHPSRGGKAEETATARLARNTAGEEVGDVGVARSDSGAGASLEETIHAGTKDQVTEKDAQADEVLAVEEQVPGAFKDEEQE